MSKTSESDQKTKDFSGKTLGFFNSVHIIIV
jgi:hypothetical protein